ncbi:F-box/LRR-repeat protein At3g48880-like [Aristolochia californica]|uniref:F-box/LRR-repeat protein At3g48880-like n=1 Tax=Aristolochia californica TaxID=171875 RepID=UPI0035DED5D1
MPSSSKGSIGQGNMASTSKRRNQWERLGFELGIRGYNDDDTIGEGKWKDLDLDLLEKIFQKVGLEERILGLPFVCKSWHKALRGNLCWKSLNFRQLSPKFRDRFCRTYLCHDRFSVAGLLKLLASRGGSSVQDLVFNKDDDITVDALAYAADKCPGVKTITLRDYRYMGNDKRLPSIISKWKDLEQLTMADIPCWFAEILKEVGANCEKMVELRIYGMIDYRETTAIVDFLPKIRRLYLYDSYLIRKDLLKLLQGCKELQVLALKNGVCFTVDEEMEQKASHIDSFDLKQAFFVFR